MLTRIEIDGFKSFEGFAVDFAPFTTIVGSNAAGKSNLFDAIELLSRLATQDVGQALESVLDPKDVIEGIFASSTSSRRRRRAGAAPLLGPLGDEIGLDRLRALPSFVQFEHDLIEALRSLSIIDDR